jgi:hypothetical protein
MLVAPIFVSRVSNDNVHQGLKVIFGDKDIHLLSSVVNEKVGTSLRTCVALFEIIVATIFQSVS